jgi:hypothetical protein
VRDASRARPTQESLGGSVYRVLRGTTVHHRRAITRSCIVNLVIPH